MFLRNRPTHVSAASANLTVAGAIAALASTFVSMVVAPVAAQDIELSNIVAGIGGFVINGQAADDRSGISVASAGDVNGDGLADVIVGANRSDPASGLQAGRSYVVFGKSSGGEVNLTDVENGVGGFIINGQAPGDYSGGSVCTAGDVNGDGLADVIVSAYLGDPASGLSAGRSYVVFGKTDTADVDLSAVDGTGPAGGVGGFVINGQGAGDLSGSSVSAAGDVNGDGLADMIVGAPLSFPAVGLPAGRSYVVFGKTSTTDVELSAIDGTGPINGVGGFVINGQATGDRAGFSVSSAGDVNGDGLADLIVGAPLSTPAGISYAGRSYVVFGKGGTADVNLSAVDLGTGGFAINGAAVGDNSGLTVSSAGDVNGDGLADVIVAAPYGDRGGEFSVGRSYVVFGKANGTDVDLTAVAGGLGGFVINGQAAYDQSGSSVSSAGDVNGDGLADVIVGARYSDPSSKLAAGRSYLVFGKDNIGQVDLSTIDNGFGGFVINGQEAGDVSGSSVSSAGDVNGDGRADLIVGADRSDAASGITAGRSYVIFSPPAVAASGVYRTVVGPGNADRQGVGTHRFGDDDTVFPDSRAWVDFDAGTTGTVVATLTRNDNGLGGIATPRVANVQWQLTTTRAAYGSVAVTLRYTDGEIAGLNEGSLTLLSAPTAAGPFVAVAGATHHLARNEFTGTVATLPRVFIIADLAAPTVEILRLDQNPTSADVVDFLVSFTEPVAPTFQTADITLNGTLGATSSVQEIIASDPDYVVRLRAKPVSSDGTLGITIGTGVADLGGNALAAPVASPLYDVDRGTPNTGGLAGDVDKNGVVNVADVTLLSNFIVNGAPPLP